MIQMKTIQRTKSRSSKLNQDSLQQELIEVRMSKKLSTPFTRQLQLNRKTQQQQSHAMVSSIIRLTLATKTCKICENKFQQGQLSSIGTCEHKFCKQCLIQYCIYKIKINQDVFCPDDGCKQKFTESNPLFNQLPQKLKQKFKQHVIWKQSLDDPNVKLCPSENCHGGLVDLLKNPPECKKCSTRYCKECMMQFHEGLCDQNFQKHFKQWKRCPKCRVFIQKNEGCNHITCRCGHQFCYVCLQNWHQSHYQCVEGNNRLFFNELQSLPRQKAILYSVAMFFFIPILLIGIIFTFISGALLGYFIGFLVACSKGGNLLKSCRIDLFIIFILILPQILAISTAINSIFFCFVVGRLQSKQLIKKYFNTCKFLRSQIMKDQNLPN